MPTRRLALVVLLAAALAAGAGFVEMGAAAGTLAWLLLIPAGLDWLALRRYSLPTVERPAELVGTLRRTLALPLRLADASAATEVAIDWPHDAGGPVPALSLAGAGPEAAVRWEVTPRKRGPHDVGDVWLRQDSPLGLWSRRVVAGGRTRVTVMPDLHGPADDGLGHELEDPGEVVGAGVPQSGSELRSLRPFVSGDDPRHVDWKATARRGQPIVREWEPDKRRSVLIVLDAGRLMRAESDGESKFDAALRATARLAMAAEARGDRVGLVVCADRVVRHVPPLSGSGQAHRLLRYIGELQPAAVETDLIQAVPHLLGYGRRSLVVVITDVLDAATGHTLTGAVAQIADRHLPIVVLLRDPQLDEALGNAVRTNHDGYRRAAAELVAGDRDRALSSLRARGVDALDLSMRSVAFEVVQRYVSARWKRAW